MRRDVPLVPEWIQQGARTVTIELIFYRLDPLGASVERTLVNDVRVDDIQGDADRLSAHPSQTDKA